MAKPIMIQGTMSNAGKSIVVGGLCRVFKQDGYRAVPFKSQNMALNSFITKDGLEMGRAQVMQAEAAGIEPCVEMNPVLLKPTSDMGSQVIVNGKVRDVMSAKEYYRYKKQLIPDIQKAYETLSSKNDIIVIEGAGSPAEINLKQDDIVNMGMAKMAKAPVLLVGDIDRGGVFAQLAGTMMFLDEDEKNYVKGMIINKFRGDAEILRPGLWMLEDRVKVPVIGVVPYFHLDIDEEDSLSERLTGTKKRGILDVVVIRFPRISNFTDFQVLSYYEEVTLRYIDRLPDFGCPDLILLPGTKNTMADLKWFRESGLEGKVQRAAKEGTPVIGICGGYQMLGEKLLDPDGGEAGDGSPKEMKGVGLLPVCTEFTKEKERTRVQGMMTVTEGMFGQLNGCKVEGYEIHMGRTDCTKGQSLTVIKNAEGEEKREGCISGNVCGTYIHGFFDSQEVSERLIRMLLERKGYDPQTVKGMDLNAYKEEQYDKLAQIIRNNLDMEAIYRILEEGV